MNFENKPQFARFCRLLLLPLFGAEAATLFDEQGPTKKALALAETNALGQRPLGRLLAVRAALALWHRQGGPALGDLLAYGDRRTNRRLGELIFRMHAAERDAPEARDAQMNTLGDWIHSVEAHEMKENPTSFLD